MAKARSGSKSGTGGGKAARGTSSRGMPGKAGVGKGELEVGNTRRDSGGSTGTRPTARRAPTGAAAQIPGEKAVRRTKQALPVEPERETPGETEPMPPEALDQRRQVVGTDEPGGRTENPSAGTKRSR